MRLFLSHILTSVDVHFMSQKSIHLSPKALKGEDSEGPWSEAPNAS